MCVVEPRERFGTQITGSQRRGIRLDHLAHFLQLEREAQRRGNACIPFEDVGIEKIPGVARPHARTDLRPRFNQSLRCQRPQRLAQHRPADAKTLHQFGFARQDGFGRKISAKNRRAEFMRHAPV